MGKKTIEEVLFEISNDAVNERFKTTTENTIQSEEKTIEALLFEISDDAVNERFKAATENIIQLEDKNEANKTITEDDKQSENELSFEVSTELLSLPIFNKFSSHMCFSRLRHHPKSL